MSRAESSVVARFGGVVADSRPMAGPTIAAELATEGKPGLLTAGECRALAAWLTRAADLADLDGAVTS